jgi:hypothetical protein
MKVAEASTIFPAYFFLRERVGKSGFRSAEK